MALFLRNDGKFEEIKGSSEYLERSLKSIAIARLDRFRLKFYFYNSTEQRQLWKEALPISSADSSFNNLTCCEKNWWENFLRKRELRLNILFYFITNPTDFQTQSSFQKFWEISVESNFEKFWSAILLTWCKITTEQRQIAS